MRRNLILALPIAVLTVAAALSFAGASSQADSEAVRTRPPATTTTTEIDSGPTPQEIEAWAKTVDLNTWNQALWVNETNRQTWIAKTNERIATERRAEEARLAEVERAAAARAEQENAPAPSSSRSAPAAEQGTGRCGGDLPPCYVMMRESGGNIRAQNPTSSASGKWQFIRSTWAGFGGYSEAYLAPESVQDAKARQLWAGGAGCGHWSAC